MCKTTVYYVEQIVAGHRSNAVRSVSEALYGQTVPEAPKGKDVAKEVTVNLKIKLD